MTAIPTQPEKTANITIEVTPTGLVVKAEYTGTLSSIPLAIERLRAAGVLELVEASRPAPPPVSTIVDKRAAAERVEPLYKPDGTACCPVHRRALSEGAHGLFCSAKAKPGQVTDKNGYCGLKFQD